MRNIILDLLQQRLNRITGKEGNCYVGLLFSRTRTLIHLTWNNRYLYLCSNAPLKINQYLFDIYLMSLDIFSYTTIKFK